jgi:hypothetical protein
VREHSERALRGIGYDAEAARIIADHAIDAALCGYEYSGLAKLLKISEHRRFQSAALGDEGAARDRTFDALQRRQQCRNAGHVPCGPRP